MCEKLPFLIMSLLLAYPPCNELYCGKQNYMFFKCYNYVYSRDDYPNAFKHQCNTYTGSHEPCGNRPIEEPHQASSQEYLLRYDASAQSPAEQ